MKISSKGRYALRMMIDVAENNASDLVAIKDVAERQEISTKYLEQIVTHLTRAKLLRSSRGSQGGYTLTKKPEEYTVGEIIRAIEGDFAPVACLSDEVNQCERADICKTLGFWTGLYKVIDQYFDSVTLQDLINDK
jgi:Rrf2 family protein